MRRQTAAILIGLFVLLLVVTIVQLNQPTPERPLPGPTSPGQLPSSTPAG